MNQILFTEPIKDTSNKSDIKKIIKYFCAFIIILGIAMIGTGTYAFLRKDEIQEVPLNKTIKPQATIQRVDDIIMITVNHNQPISYIEYNWNGEDTYTIYGNGRSNIAESIELIEGNNVLNVKVKDESNNESNYTEEFSLSVGGDIEKPSINMEIAGNNIKITATDETEMDNISYYWEDEDETIIEATEGSKTIEANVEVRKGKNKLTVTAEDTSGNTETQSKICKGITIPDIKVVREGNELVISVADEDGIKYIDIDLNDQKYRLNIEDNAKEITYTLEMISGNNVLKVVAYDINSDYSSFEGESQL